MDKFFKSKKTAKILNILILLFGIIVLIMQLSQGVSFSNPIIWVMIILVFFALLELLTFSNK